ncbi:MAG: hypothetical protein DMG96_08895 [Acidobacteria bacterium]|nr:MAG: hypothetical protein DMG96_08895 [Acidobacteriota bacterium]
MKLVEKSVVASRFNPQTAIGLLIAIAVLYLAREVLIPIALALLLSFLLAPAMVRLQHWGLGKTLAALLVVALSFFGLMLISWVGFGQAPKTCRKSQAQTLSLQLEISGFSGRQNQVSWARGRGFQSLERLARGRGLVSCVLPVSTGSRHALRSTDRSPRRMDSRPANRDCCALVRIILLALSTANSCDS